MNEYLIEAREELKRLEHIIYVSLKYTRTVDVILGALKRMVSTFDLIIEGFLEKALEEGKITSLPKSPALRATTVAEMYTTDPIMQRDLGFYSFLKTVLKLPYRKREEFRRHVTLIVDLEKATAEIDIDTLINCEKFVHRFLKYAWHVIEGKPQEEEEF